MTHEPHPRDDAQNLSLVTASALVAVLATVGILRTAPEPAQLTYVEVVEDGTVAVETPVREASDRLYGTVEARDGRELTGFIRWDRNEGSWVDLLDATKPRERGGSSISGIRFGHVDRIDVLSRSAALFVLRSGEAVELRGRATDLGSGLRALEVTTSDGTVVELGWRDLRSVDFRYAPDASAREQRLFGTLTTRSGIDFTGYLTWDVDEIYTSDVLDGDDQVGERRRVPFGEIAAIERDGPWAARVTLRSGEILSLDGTNDVDESIRGISVSDPGLGQVAIEWDALDRVRFQAAPATMDLTVFDGGAPLRGTVTTAAGLQLAGRVLWDRDEAYTWEMLSGEADGVELDVELGRVDTITRSARGARVTLLDGRTFELHGSNDVDDGNRGIAIETDDASVVVPWEDFVSLRLEG